MMHVLEESDLPEGPLGVYGGLERSGKLLDGHFDVSVCVHSRARDIVIMLLLILLWLWHIITTIIMHNYQM